MGVVWGTEVRYSFSIRELIYLLFRKKECPKCGRDLIRHKYYEKRTETRNPLFKDKLKVKDNKYYFVCTACESNFPLAELARIG